MEKESTTYIFFGVRLPSETIRKLRAIKTALNKDRIGRKYKKVTFGDILITLIDNEHGKQSNIDR